MTSPINITWRAEEWKNVIWRLNAEGTHQRLGDHRPGPIPSHLPGPRHPSPQWTASEVKLPGHYKTEKRDYSRTLEDHICNSMKVLIPTYLGHEGSQTVDEQIGLGVAH